MIKQLLLLSLLTLQTIQGMDLTKYIHKSIQKSEDLYDAIEKNDYYAIYHFCEQNKRINCDPQKVKKLCLENIQWTENNTRTFHTPALWGFFGTVMTGYYAWMQYYLAFDTRHEEIVSDNQFFGAGLLAGSFAAMGLNALYNMATNSTNKAAFKNSVIIKHLLTERGYIDSSDSETENTEV